MPNTSIEQLPFFHPMEPVLKDLYARFMQLADDCKKDRVVPVDDPQWLVSFAMASNFPNMMSGMTHVAEQSRMLEEESLEIAYLLLKSTCTANV